MKVFLKKIVQVTLPLDLEENLLDEINDDTYKLIINLPIFSKIPCFFFIVLCNFFSFKNFLVPFYFCNRIDRKDLIKKNLIFKSLNGNLLKIIITYSSLVFYDNPKVQNIIGYKE